IEKYGSYDKNNRKGMYYTITQKPNSSGLFLNCNADLVQVQHTSGQIILEWTIDSVAERFSQKIKSVILVSAKVELREDREYFYYYRARLLKGSMDRRGLINAFISGDFVIDLRLHDKKTMARNHGTGFRVQENKLINLFSNISEIEL
ncbi:MAG: MvaI/BcnI family restriction endonuclease, partial [Oligoflexia bacterium]|nr:MvaI/BcnI family restriction endonuclease [Oligoflexia bacterium]